MPAQKVGRAIRRPLKKSDGRSAGRSESRTGAFSAAQKVGRWLRWPLRKSDGRSAGRSESRTVAPLAAQKVGRALLRPLRKSDGRSAGRSESWTLGDFEEVVTLGVAKASKPIFPIRGGRFLRVDGRSESWTVALLAAQKVGRWLRWPLRKSDGRSAGRSKVGRWGISRGW